MFNVDEPNDWIFRAECYFNIHQLFEMKGHRDRSVSPAQRSGGSVGLKGETYSLIGMT